MTKKQKLELTWIGKENRPKLEPRILLEDAAKSYHAKYRVKPDSREDAKARSEKQENLESNPDNAASLDGCFLRVFASSRENEIGDIFDNKLIFGDNLLALKALEAEFAGKVKCVFIDPPYNTGSAFTHYDDGVEHSIWLSLMRDRLEIIRRLLSDDGSLWITIDDNEAHYLKVMCDEVFGRANFAANCFWQKVYSERMDARGFSVSHDHLMVYQKTDKFFPLQLPKDQNAAQFGFFDESVKKYYRRRSLRKEGSESLRQDRPSMWYAIPTPDGSEIWPVKPDGTEGRWRWKKENVPTNMDQLEFIKKDGTWEIYVKQYLEEKPTRPPATFWPNEEVGHNHEAKLEVRAFNSQDIFDTPKPERLLKRVLEIATIPGDFVLDSFAGSGTTGAVAHKMGRRWIMIELGEHCHTHIIPRLQKVIDGEDKGGISGAVNWQGGGGFRYYKLAPSLLRQDAYGQWVINKEYNAEMLAQALCKLEGFTYAPSDAHYWMHGHSTERDFIYVTTANLNHEQLQALNDEVGANSFAQGVGDGQRANEFAPTGGTLLVLCTAFRGRGEYPNLTVKKIPKQVLSRCEWGHDDYSLQVENLPKAPEKQGQQDLFGSREDAKARR